MNYRRKSVTGLSVDYFTLNILGHGCYTVSSIAFLYSSTIREQYRRRWGDNVGDPTVRVNDLAFTVRWAGHTGMGVKRDARCEM